MRVFRHGERTKVKSSWFKRLLILLIIFSAIAAAVIVNWYKSNTSALDATNETSQVVTVLPGANESAISSLLEDRGLIKSALAYQIYSRVNGLQGRTQAGSYDLSPSMSVGDIINKFVDGDVAVDLITILPAQRLADLREFFIEEGYSESEVDNALNPDSYRDHPALVDKPPLASLEGYLYPESFQYTSTTPLRAIIGSSLDQTALLFSAKNKQILESRGLTLHQAVIVASIVEKEVSNLADKPIVAQVFLTRFDRSISLGSDVTAHYGASLFGLEESVAIDTPYNTRIHLGLPPGPISNISASSFQAVLKPAKTDYLFFVAGDDGITYFSHTTAQHEALAAQHCIILCQAP